MLKVPPCEMSIPHPQYNLLANKAHQSFLMKDQPMSNALGALEVEINAQRNRQNTLTEEELATKYGELSAYEVDDLIRKKKELQKLSDRLRDKGASLDGQLAELMAEKERRGSKWWLQKVLFQ